MPELPGKPSKPPKQWWQEKLKEVKKGNPSYSDEQAKKTVGSIWYGLTPKKRKEILRRYEKSEVCKDDCHDECEECVMNKEDVNASELLAELQPTFVDLFKALDENRFNEELWGKKKEDECPVMDKLKKQDRDMVNWIKEEVAKMCSEVEDRGQRGKMIRKIWKRAKAKFKASVEMPDKWEDFLPTKEEETYTVSDLLSKFKKYLGTIEKAQNDMLEKGKLARGAKSV